MSTSSADRRRMNRRRRASLRLQRMRQRAAEAGRLAPDEAPF